MYITEIQQFKVDKAEELAHTEKLNNFSERAFTAGQEAVRLAEAAGLATYTESNQALNNKHSSYMTPFEEICEGVRAAVRETTNSSVFSKKQVTISLEVEIGEGKSETYAQIRESNGAIQFADKDIRQETYSETRDQEVVDAFQVLALAMENLDPSAPQAA